MNSSSILRGPRCLPEQRLQFLITKDDIQWLGNVPGRGKNIYNGSATSQDEERTYTMARQCPRTRKEHIQWLGNVPRTRKEQDIITFVCQAFDLRFYVFRVSTDALLESFIIYYNLIKYQVLYHNTLSLIPAPP